MTPPNKHELKILRETVKNPAKWLLNPHGYINEEYAIKTLKTKFKYTDKQIKQLKGGKWLII